MYTDRQTDTEKSTETFLKAYVATAPKNWENLTLTNSWHFVCSSYHSGKLIVSYFNVTET
jgi:hypothetical protein